MVGKKLLFLSGLCLIAKLGLCQVDKGIDSIQQEKKIQQTPTDTVPSQPEKFENPKQGGEHSGKDVPPKLNKEGHPNQQMKMGKDSTIIQPKRRNRK